MESVEHGGIDGERVGEIEDVTTTSRSAYARDSEGTVIALFAG